MDKETEFYKMYVIYECCLVTKNLIYLDIFITSTLNYICLMCGFYLNIIFLSFFFFQFLSIVRILILQTFLPTHNMYTVQSNVKKDIQLNIQYFLYFMF